MNPHIDLPPTAFCKLAIASKNLFDINDIWDPKFNMLKEHNVVTFGSCFAQHIGNSLQEKGFKWLRTEVPPMGLSKELSKKI